MDWDLKGDCSFLQSDRCLLRDARFTLTVHNYTRLWALGSSEGLRGGWGSQSKSNANVETAMISFPSP
jgi:hypothetical protein